MWIRHCKPWRITSMNPVPSPRCLRKNCQKCLRCSELERERAPNGSLNTHFWKVKSNCHNLISPQETGMKASISTWKIQKVICFLNTNQERMATQPPFINVKKIHNCVCGEMKCREGENYGVVPDGKVGETEVSFHYGILRILMGVRGGKYSKIWKCK